MEEAAESAKHEQTDASASGKTGAESAGACTAQSSNIGEDRIVVGRGGNHDGQGPHIHLTAEIIEGRIVNPTFKTYSCPAAFLSSQALCDLVEDKLLADLAGITEQDLIGCIGHDLPRSKRHCIHIAMEALVNFTASAVKRSCDVPI